MGTRVVPEDRSKTWEEIVGFDKDTPKGEREVLNSVLYLVSSHLRPNIGEKSRYVHQSQFKRIYGKILWEYLGSSQPSKENDDVPVEIGRLYFAFYLRKVLEAKPIVSREFNN